MATAAMTRLSRLLTSSSIIFATKQALQVPRSLHPTIRLRDLCLSRGQRTQDTGI
ncbi:hypothetical protein DPMN_163183 [Dreissena polymorpha]|uniref:Uncharacterized protein n=1 Tax=Dreissena polymorpha TaxID=45954 RepID=A0A9D4ESR2_DREPO|nr:hypothetical protein DPMN_163183 [Dreissena polymorpha]